MWSALSAQTRSNILQRDELLAKRAARRPHSALTSWSGLNWNPSISSVQQQSNNYLGWASTHSNIRTEYVGPTGIPKNSAQFLMRPSFAESITQSTTVLSRRPRTAGEGGARGRRMQGTLPNHQGVRPSTRTAEKCGRRTQRTRSVRIVQRQPRQKSSQQPATLTSIDFTAFFAATIDNIGVKLPPTEQEKKCRANAQQQTFRSGCHIPAALMVESSNSPQSLYFQQKAAVSEVHNNCAKSKFILGEQPALVIDKKNEDQKQMLQSLSSPVSRW